jgi:transcription termination factor NusB
MSSRTETWVAGIVGVAVGALLAVTIFLISQPPAAREQATGAIGAAERFRTEQIKEGDTGISGTFGSAGQFTAVDFAAVLGRVGSDLRVEALNQATLEQQAAMFANADVLEKVNSLFRIDSAMQKQIMEKMKVGERQAIERLAGERATGGKITAETLSRLAPGERFNSLNQATLEQQAAMFANMDAFEKAWAFARLDSAIQRQIVDRMGPYERADFERVLNERVVQDRISSGRVGQERVVNQRAVEQ